MIEFCSSLIHSLSMVLPRYVSVFLSCLLGFPTAIIWGEKIDFAHGGSSRFF